MEKREWIDNCRRVFTRIIQETLWRDFVFPGGPRTEQVLGRCFEALGSSVCPERLVDFCITQGYAISGFGTEYRRRWNIAHSFGQKAVKRYAGGFSGRKFYEDRWLDEHGLSRSLLAGLVATDRPHPLSAFIYPEYEEATKRRLLHTEAGYVVCALSTFLWTPFSPTCRRCRRETPCKERTAGRYPELYRLRLAVWRDREAER